jgi:MFS superfamily sulfate permease-like transporter
MMPAIFPPVGRLIGRTRYYAGRAVHRAARIAWAVTPRWLRVPLEFCAAVAILPAVFLLTGRLGRIIRAVMPRWMLAAFVVCLAIPGPFDEAAMIVAGLILAVFRYRRTVSAWRGGKSHRVSDAQRTAHCLPA